MNKWRLLLFSVFGLLQITTSDRFIDGREQCCNHRIFRSDTRLSTYEPYRLSPELRQLKSPGFRRIDQERRSIRGFNRRESPQDESRQAIENRRIRELTDVTERDISRARSYEDRTITSGNVRRDAFVNRDRQLALNTRSTITRDDYRRNDARSHLENRDLRRYSTYTRETFSPNTHGGRINVRNDISERELRKGSRLVASPERSINADYDKENRNTMQNTRQVRIVRANRDDSRALQNARKERFETRIVNNIDDRVSRLRTRRSSLEDLHETDALSFRIRSARNYDSVESRNNARFIRDNRNRDETQNENRARINRENGRDNVRDSSLGTVGERFATENRLSERSNERNIRLSKRSVSEERERNVRTNMYTDKSNIIANARSRVYRETAIQRVHKNSEKNRNRNDRVRKDNHNNRLSRRTIDKDALNIMERHIQVDGSRIPGHFNSRDSRDNRISERRSNERIVRDRSDGLRRERTVRNDVRQERLYDMEESRIRSSIVSKTYDSQNTREDLNNELRRARSNSAEPRNFHDMDERHSARRNRNQDAPEYRSRELRQEQNIRSQMDVSRMYRKNTPTDNEVRKSKYNVNEALHRIRSQSPQERRLTREARDSITREQTTRDESLHRIRSRSLEERFSRVQEDRDEYITRSVRVGELRQQRGCTAENRRAYAPRIRNMCLSTNNDVRNSRYNDDEDFRQIRSLETQDRSYRNARDTSVRTNIHGIRDSREESRIMQGRQITPRDRYETRIRIANLQMSSDRNIRDNDESHRRMKRNTMERQNIERESRDRSVSLPNNLRNSRNNNEESRRMQSRGIEERTLARKRTHDINMDARNTRNIRELNEVRSRSMQDRRDIRETQKDEVRIHTNYARTSEIRNIRDFRLSRQTRRERSTERLMGRNIRENRQNHENHRENVEQRTNLVRENREILNIDSIRAMPMFAKQSENCGYEIKWQYLFYALQGIYLCSLFMKISKDEKSKKNFRTTSWLSPVHYLKID